MDNHQCFCILKLIFFLFIVMWNDKESALATRGKRRNKHVRV